MACNFCGTQNVKKFLAEIDVHFRGLKNVTRNPVLIYPEILLCLNCGKAEFTVPSDELALLAKCDAAEDC